VLGAKKHQADSRTAQYSASVDAANGVIGQTSQRHYRTEPEALQTDRASDIAVKAISGRFSANNAIFPRHSKLKIPQINIVPYPIVRAGNPEKVQADIQSFAPFWPASACRFSIQSYNRHRRTT